LRQAYYPRGLHGFAPPLSPIRTSRAGEEIGALAGASPVTTLDLLGKLDAGEGVRPVIMPRLVLRLAPIIAQFFLAPVIAHASFAFAIVACTTQLGLRRASAGRC